MTEGLYNLVYENLSMKTAGILLGLALIGAHLFACLKADPTKKWLVKLPRNKNVGIAVLVICTLWSWVLITWMDLGEFYTIRKFVQFFLPVACFLVVQFVDEFLSVRAIGVLMMLVAGPVLNSAFLEGPPLVRLLVPILAYVWIIVGMFWVGMPYLMRDWIDWVVAEGTDRWKKACYAGMGYGGLLLLFALFLYP